MNKQLKSNWLSGLRSGKYKQGRDVLRSRRNRYCCLGVLADVAGASWEENEERDAYEMRLGRSKSRSWSRVCFTDPQLKRLGLTCDQHNHLIGMNDEGKRFSTIANWIEKNV